MTYNQNSEKGLDHECSLFFVCKNRLKLYLSKDGWFTVNIISLNPKEVS